LYTKVGIRVIALLLAAIAFKQYVSPDAVALAQGQFAGEQFPGRYLSSILGQARYESTPTLA
jgi:hypothetical protein